MHILSQVWSMDQVDACKDKRVNGGFTGLGLFLGHKRAADLAVFPLHAPSFVSVPRYRELS